VNRRERRAGVAFARHTADEWHPFERRAGAEASAAHIGDIRSCWLNNVYSVQVYARTMADGRVALQLAVRRHDGEDIRGWSVLQRIKNELVGQDRVAIEVYPREEDLIDDAPMRHLFVLPAGDEAPFTIRGEWR
jgi:hypothetical protein